MRRMENKFEQDFVAYKYLDSNGKAFINGMHAVLEDLQGLFLGGETSEIASIIGDNLIEEISESTDKDRADRLKAYDTIGGDILKKIADIIQNHVEGDILNTVEGFADAIDDYEAHKEEVDKRYDEIVVVRDMTLVDSEGYTYGVIKSVSTTESGTTCDVVLEEPDEDGTKEVTLTEADVKTFALMEPCPQYVTYTKGKKISHYMYGGDVEEDV